MLINLFIHYRFFLIPESLAVAIQGRVACSFQGHTCKNTNGGRYMIVHHGEFVKNHTQVSGKSLVPPTCRKLCKYMEDP